MSRTAMKAKAKKVVKKFKVNGLVKNKQRGFVLPPAVDKVLWEAYQQHVDDELTLGAARACLNGAS